MDIVMSGSSKPEGAPRRGSGGTPEAGRGDRAERSPHDRDAMGGVNTRPAPASNREQRRVEAEEDRVLIEAAQRGDRQAFRRLVERHQRRVFAIAFSMVRDENDAREIAQEAFLRVYRSLDQFKGGSSVFTWIYRIVTNLSIDLMRRPGRRDLELHDRTDVVDPADESMAPLVSTPEHSDPFKSTGRRELAERLQQALDTLPPYHLGVILMREVEGMSYEEMAEAMNVSKGTIMSRLFHARQKLQRALASCYAEETGVDPSMRGEDLAASSGGGSGS